MSIGEIIIEINQWWSVSLYITTGCSKISQHCAFQIIVLDFNQLAGMQNDGCIVELQPDSNVHIKNFVMYFLNCKRLT